MRRAESIKDGLESETGDRLRGDHWIIPWIVKHAAAMMNMLRITADGKTAECAGNRSSAVSGETECCPSVFEQGVAFRKFGEGLCQKNPEVSMCFSQYFDS